MKRLVRVDQSSKVCVSDLPLLSLLPGGTHQLGPELEDQAENVLDDLHDSLSLLVQQTPACE